MDIFLTPELLPTELKQLSAVTLALFELLEMIKNATEKTHSNGMSSENGVILNCTGVSNYSFYTEFFTTIFAVLCLPVFAFMTRRVSYHTYCCSGRPGLTLPMKFTESHGNIFQYTVAYLSVSEDIYAFVFGGKSEFGTMIPIAKFFLKLFMVIVFTIIFYPTFAALTNKKIVFYTLALILVALYLLFDIMYQVDELYCLTGVKMAPFLTASVTYSFFNIILIVIFIIKIVRHCKYRGIHFSASEISKRNCYMEYVKDLFKMKKVDVIKIDNKQNEEEEDTGKEFLNHFKCSEMKTKVREKVYREIPGFSMPPRLIIGIAVGSYFAFRILINIILDLTPTAWNLLRMIVKDYPPNSNLSRSFDIATSNNFSQFTSDEFLNAHRYLVFSYTHLLIACIMTGVVLAFLNSIIQSFFIVRNYRLLFHRLVRKGFSYFIPLKRAPSPSVLILGFVRFSGYQAAYILWSIIIVSGFLSILLYSFIAAFLFPLFYIKDSYAYNFVINILPILIASLILNFIQGLAVKYFFSKEKGQLMEIDNRRAFAIFTHSAFFLNAMMGVFSSAKRIIVWLFFGILTFGRIDFSNLPQYIHGCDSGFVSFIGFVYTEIYHHNPILRCFVNILLTSYHEDELINDRTVTQTSEVKENYLMPMNVRKPTTKKTKLKWLLLYTLVNNKSLILERKWVVEPRDID